MRTEKCPLCGSVEHHTIYHGVRQNVRVDFDKQNGCDLSIDVLKCEKCGLVRLNSLPDNVEKFFQKSGMRDFKPADAEELRRAGDEEYKRYFAQTETLIEDKDVVDFGCGCGGYLLYAKRKAKHIAGVELEDSMRAQLVENGLECVASIDEVGKADVITLFHVLSHFDDPIASILKLKQHLKPGGLLYIESPNVEDALLSLYNCDPFTHHAFHRDMACYWSKTTLAILAEKTGLKVDAIRFIQRYPIGNHLYWLSHGKPGGHVKWDYLGSEKLHQEYEKILAGLGKTDTIICALKN